MSRIYTYWLRQITTRTRLNNTPLTKISSLKITPTLNTPISKIITTINTTKITITYQISNCLTSINTSIRNIQIYLTNTTIKLRLSITIIPIQNSLIRNIITQKSRQNSNKSKKKRNQSNLYCSRLSFLQRCAIKKLANKHKLLIA